MKSRVLILTSIVVPLAVSSWFVLHAVADEPLDQTVPRPDLVIEKVVLDQKLGSQTPPFEISVFVKNIGTAEAAPSVTAVMSTTGVRGRRLAPKPLSPQPETPASPDVSVIGALATPIIPVGGQAMVKVTVQGALSSRWFIFLADAPVPGHASGQVGEGVGDSAYGPEPLGELNNCFAVPLDPGNGYVQTFTNAAVPQA